MIAALDWKALIDGFICDRSEVGALFLLDTVMEVLLSSGCVHIFFLSWAGHMSAMLFAWLVSSKGFHADFLLGIHTSKQQKQHIRKYC